MTYYENLNNKIKKCKNIQIKDVKLTEIDSINDIKINTNESSTNRIIDFINKAKNPYIIKVDDTIVRMEYKSNDIDAINCIKKIVLENI